MARRSKTDTHTNTTTQTRQGRVVSIEQIPDKMYFRIGEVAEILAVKSHVLRYWEKEFALLKPQKSRAGQRMYRRRDVEVLLHIRSLLYDRGYTIAGASKMLKGGLSHLPPLGLAPVGLAQAGAQNAADVSSAASGARSAAHSGSVDSLRPASGSVIGQEANGAAQPMPATADRENTQISLPPSAEQLALALQNDPLVSRKKDIVRSLKQIIALCDHTDAQDVDPFTQLRQDQKKDSEEHVVVATSRRHS